jgi:hypothetical protein
MHGTELVRENDAEIADPDIPIFIAAKSGYAKL